VGRKGVCPVNGAEFIDIVRPSLKRCATGIKIRHEYGLGIKPHADDAAAAVEIIVLLGVVPVCAALKSFETMPGVTLISQDVFGFLEHLVASCQKLSQVFLCQFIAANSGYIAEWN
jgi:hypothetical protein